jgi:hypothetical protein
MEMEDRWRHMAFGRQGLSRRPIPHDLDDRCLLWLTEDVHASIGLQGQRDFGGSADAA